MRTDGQGQRMSLIPFALTRTFRLRAPAPRGMSLALLTTIIIFSAFTCRRSLDSTSLPRFGELVETFSEPGGYFDTDNLISNETSYVQVMERLEPAGGAYVGVGPEQNFNYIARIRPNWAFILDIRRENMLHHLLLNAIFSKARTPYQYLCWMFSRPVRDEIEPDATAGIDEVVSAFEQEAPQTGVQEGNLKTLLRYIQDRLEITLTPEDQRSLRSIYETFYRDQLEIRFHSHGRRPMPYHPTYRRLLLARSPTGKASHFLASFEGYTYVRELAGKGRIIPVVGDFAGPHALRAIGEFLKERGEWVSAFYVSNVEFYLLRSGRFQAYVENIRSLPLGQDSLFIRAYFDYGLSHPARLPGHRSTVIMQRMPRFLALYDAQAYRSYWDVCTLDYVP